MQQLFKQIEMKNMEVQRFRTAAEVAKVHLFNVRHIKQLSFKTKLTLCLLITTIFVFNPFYFPIKSLLLGIK